MSIIQKVKAYFSRQWRGYLEFCKPPSLKRIEKSHHEYLNGEGVSLEHKFQYIMTTAISDALPGGNLADLETVLAWTSELMLAVEVQKGNKQ